MTAPGMSGGQPDAKSRKALFTLGPEGPRVEVMEAARQRDALLQQYAQRLSNGRSMVEEARRNVERARTEGLPIDEYPETIRDARRRQQGLVAEQQTLKAVAVDPSQAPPSAGLLAELNISTGNWTLEKFINALMTRADELAANSARGTHLEGWVAGVDESSLQSGLDVMAAFRGELGRAKKPNPADTNARIVRLGEVLVRAQRERDAAAEAITQRAGQRQQEEARIREALRLVGEEIEGLIQALEGEHQKLVEALTQGERLLSTEIEKVIGPIVGPDDNMPADILSAVITLLRNGGVQVYQAQINEGLNTLAAIGGTEEIRGRVRHIQQVLSTGNVEEALTALGQLSQVLASALQVGGGASGGGTA